MGRLRSKTGCVACRSKRKKCDERFPACSRCKTAGSECQWPTSEEQTDRRYAASRSERYAAARRSKTRMTPTLSDDEIDADVEADDEADEQIQVVFPTGAAHGSRTPTSTTSVESQLCLLSASAAHQVLRHDLESIISRHFVEKYYRLILLPDGHPDFYNGWIGEIQDLMMQYKSMQYSVLTCAASHMHFIDTSPQMQELALTYYSKAIRGVSEILSHTSELENHNGLLMSVMLLYLHGCMGRGTYTDIPRHVNAAIRILRLRLLSRPLTIERPFDRLAVESVLYQVFLVTTGSWSDPMELDYQFDAHFWAQAERLLSQSRMFPGRSISFNSPVLGIPMALFRMVLSIKQLYQSPFRHDPETLEELRSELQEWEGTVLSDQDLNGLLPDEPRGPNYPFYKSGAYLYVLVLSLLVAQLSENEDEGESATGPPRAAPSDCWQVRKAVQILQQHRHDDDWARCFLGNWPIYSLGFFMSAPKHVELVREELKRRWDLMRFAQIVRFGKDLETTWARRGYSKGGWPQMCTVPKD